MENKNLILAGEWQSLKETQNSRIILSFSWKSTTYNSAEKKNDSLQGVGGFHGFIGKRVLTQSFDMLILYLKIKLS